MEEFREGREKKRERGRKKVYVFKHCALGKKFIIRSPKEIFFIFLETKKKKSEENSLK